MTEDHARLYNVCLSTAQFLAALILGIWGLSSWRQQLYGKYHFGLASRIAKQVYKLKEEIWEFRRYGLADAEEHRINRIRQLHGRLRDSVRVAHVMWGDPIKEAENGLTETVHKFTICVQLLREKKQQNIPERALTEADIKQHQDLHAVAYILPPDAFGTELDAAVKKFWPILHDYLPPKVNPFMALMVWISLNLKRLRDEVEKSGSDPT